MTWRRPRTYTATESALASAAAEVAAAQQRTRDVEAERQRLETELTDLAGGIERARAATASALVTLIRSAGVGREVTNILVGLYQPEGWHQYTDYREGPDDDDDL